MPHGAESRRGFPSVLFVCLLPFSFTPPVIAVSFQSTQLIFPAAVWAAGQIPIHHLHTSPLLPEMSCWLVLRTAVTFSAAVDSATTSLALLPPHLLCGSIYPLSGPWMDGLMGIMVCCAEPLFFSYGCPRVVNQRGEKREKIHTSMMLTSLLFGYFLFN